MSVCLCESRRVSARRARLR
ncbi:Protein of unknown function, partial [Gryllus bimaculatus]